MKDKLKQHWWILVIALVVVISLVFLLKGDSKFDTTKIRVIPLLQTASQIAEDDPVKGTGEIILVEFSDYECPYCGRFFKEVEILLEEEFKDKISFVYKDYPLDQACNENLKGQVHDNACAASLAAECAKEQDRFWQYHDTLFQNQDSINTQKLMDYASLIGLNMKQFNKCFESQKYIDEIKSDIAQGNSLGVTGTPALIIGNKLVVGFYPYEAYKALIEEELGQ